MNAHHYVTMQLLHAKNDLKTRFHEYEFCLDDGRDPTEARADVLAAMNVAMDAMAEFHKHSRT